jgi:exodeoxyribonuclease VII small subunit
LGAKARADSGSAIGAFYFVRDLLPKPHAHGPVTAPGLMSGLLLEKLPGRIRSAPRHKITLLIPGVLRYMVTASKHGPAAPAHYEAALQELEQLVARLESGEMPLEQLLTQYQRGAELLKFCRDRLAAVEDQIKVLDQGALKAWSGESA